MKLEIIDAHGPCSLTNQNQPTSKPSHAEIFRLDQSRAEHIQARIKFNNAKFELTARSGLPYTFNYIVPVGLGTPKKDLYLIFDTGSDLSWTQCQPCSLSCYNQTHPIFDPSASTSYSNFSCTKSEECYVGGTSLATCSSTHTCIYALTYSDGSLTAGFLGKEKLTLTPKEVLPDFLFGCGQLNSGSMGRTDGLLGLGRANSSIVSQTAEKYKKQFSYCLPSVPSSKGFLKFGKDCNNTGSEIKFTPLTFKPESPSFYFIDIISIAVGGYTLPIHYQTIFRKLSAGTIIDSGTIITRLPPIAYKALRDEFRKHMTKYDRAPEAEDDFLDTCYRIRKNKSITIPHVSFTFTNNVEVNLHAFGIMIVIDPSATCLAFAANEQPTDLAIFGNNQQKTLEVVYDVAGEKLGFRSGMCP
ncbi:eukaryotic aspartyl protease family protein [Striga asiatica]|uniref:Eukaryotic aspartyl protease family protein n=1 Tax=Striga asiatica TaxID=4170 RepID=A0A5A7PMU9_STRAF|nr:eukaryotic aspartyl protease family protein [Striga asiatica]